MLLTEGHPAARVLKLEPQRLGDALDRVSAGVLAAFRVGTVATAK